MSNLKSLNYTDRDMETILQSMVSQIPNITTKWTDFNPSDPGMAILELLSWVLESLHFYQDHQINEAFLPTAKERKNIINLCKLIAYRLSGSVSSTAIEEFSIDSPLASKVIIPKHTRVSTKSDDVIYFATIEDAYIPVGETSVLVSIRQGVVATETFRTNGQPEQKFTLSESSVDAQSVELVINSVIWTQVESFVSSQATDNHYIVNIDPSTGKTYIQLGDGYYGNMPAYSSVINVSITYLVSSGSSGNVGSNAIVTLIDNLLDELSNPVSVSVNNIQAATGGDDLETIEHAKKQAPAELAALYRAMTRGDFIALSEGFPGVGKASCWGEQEINPPNYDLFNWVMVCIAPENVTRSSLIQTVDNGEPSDELKNELLSYLYSRATITTRIKMLSVTYVPIDLGVTVYYSKNASPIKVRNDVENAVLDFLSFDNVEFGKELRLSNIIALVDSVDGVEYCEINTFCRHILSNPSNPPSDIQIAYDELPFLYDFAITMTQEVPQPILPEIYPCPGENPIP